MAGDERDPLSDDQVEDNPPQSKEHTGRDIQRRTKMRELVIQTNLWDTERLALLIPMPFQRRKLQENYEINGRRGEKRK